MSWSPEEARKRLDASPIVTFVRSVKKISGFRVQSGREIALSEENLKKVTVYASAVPHHMPDVVVEEEYLPSATKSGRHADLESVARSLGFEHKAYRLHIKSQDGLVHFINWYKYA